MISIIYCIALAVLIDVAFAGICEDRMKNAPALLPDSASQQEHFDNFRARCLACQDGEEKPDGVGDTCEYCLGHCIHEDVGGDPNNPLFCNGRKRALGKRASCDGKCNIGEDCTHAFTTKPPHVIHTESSNHATEECLGGSGSTCAGGTNGRVTASHVEQTFPPPETQPPPPSPAAPQTPNPTPASIQNQTPGNNGATTAANSQRGAVCKAGPPPVYVDRCGKCGGNNICASPAARVASSLLIVAVALFALMF
mmetsp:Transcript_22870/g.38869  ORF Transcript_22870/g.38869 Transcript_22870/m.38869 type:complete len:253 (-) Transcript_22870:89-847(-)